MFLDKWDKVGMGMNRAELSEAQMAELGNLASGGLLAKNLADEAKAKKNFQETHNSPLASVPGVNFNIWDMMKQNQEGNAKAQEAAASVQPKSVARAPAFATDLSGDAPVGESTFSLKVKPSSYESQLEQAFFDQIKQREGDANDAKAKLAKLEKEQPTGFQTMNLKPLLAFADSMNGGRTASAYEAPTAKQEWEAKKQKLQDSLTKDKNALNDDQLNYLKMKAQEEATDKRTQMALAAQERMADRGRNSDEKDLRKQYLGHPLYKNMAEVSQAYEGIANNPGDTGPAQQAMVYQFSKLLDPGSVVRETEYAMSAGNAGKIAQARNYFERLQSGKMLMPDQVRLMKEVAKGLATSSRKLLDSHNATFKQLAMTKGIAPDNVVIDPFNKFGASAGGSNQDQQAIEWARQNPNDPRSKAILQKNGVQ